MNGNLVPAICTQCGAVLSVNPEQEAAICECCKTPFIVKKAIQNYSIHIQNANSVIIQKAVITNGQTAENFVKRADEFLKRSELEKAEEYYNRALDIDTDCKEARIGLQRLNTNRIISQARYMAQNNQTAKAVAFLQQSISQDVDRMMIEQEIFRLKQEICGKVLYSGQAYYRFSAFQLAATEVYLSFDINELRLSSGNKAFSIATPYITGFSPCENTNYVGEAFGRSEPNCIRVTSVEPATGKIQKTDIRVHNAKMVAEYLNNQLENVKIL